jgi:hypothetical protein
MVVSGVFKDFTNGLTAFAVFQPETCNSSFLGNSGALFDSHDNTAFNYRDGLTIGRNPTPAQNATGDGLLLITNGTSNTGQVGITGGGSWVPAKPELLAFRLPAAAGDALVAGTAFVDGVSEAPSPNDPLIPEFTDNRTTTYIGYNAGIATGYHPYCGGIGELLVYSKALSDADRQAIETHLRTRWGL